VDRPSSIDNNNSTGNISTRAMVVDNIRYSLHRSRRRTISVEVRVSGAIVVRSPIRMPLNSIEAFLSERIAWIVSRLERAAEARTSLPLPGVGEYYLRGELQTLERLIPVDTRSSSLRSRNEARKAYRNIARTYFPEVVENVLPLMGVHGLRYSGLKLRSMHRRWGSCTGAGVITLNDSLAMTPDHCIRAVIVHELCHLVHMDHGAAFRRMTRDIMPDIDAADADLDRWSALLSRGAATKNGAQGPVEDRTLVLKNSVIERFPAVNNAQESQTQIAMDYADAGAHSWSNDAVSAEAIISGVRPSM